MELLRYEGQEVVEVKEFQVAAALLEKRDFDVLGRQVPSQWGPVHLFDLCLAFGHFDVAWQMAREVKGCKLQAHHLGRVFAQREPRPARTASPYIFRCSCRGLQSCDHCCFGFDVEDGLWMEDAEMELAAAQQAARISVKKPLLHRIFEVFHSEGAELIDLPFEISDQAMANLLDLAMLTGDHKVVSCRCGLCRMRPLRRWRSSAFVEEAVGSVSSVEIPVSSDEIGHGVWRIFWPRTVQLSAALRSLLAALLVIKEFQCLWNTVITVKYLWSAKIPFPEALTLFYGSSLPEVADLLPPAQSNWIPEEGNHLGVFFFEDREQKAGLSKSHLRLAKIAGMEVNSLGVQAVWLCPSSHTPDRILHWTLLDVAISLGDSDTAALLASLPCAELSTWGIRFRPEWSDPARKSAAVAGACAALQRSWRSEIMQTGIAMYQVFRKLSAGSSFPMSLVDQVVAYSMEVPEILYHLDLWKDVQFWYLSDFWHRKSVSRLTTRDHPIPLVDGVNEDGDRLQSSSFGESGKPKQDETDQTLRAIQESRHDGPPALNVDGVCLFRLTRMATAVHVNKLLLDASGPLQALHARVLEAGCEVKPQWSPVKALFVPCTEAQAGELLGLAAHGYELCRDSNILALQEDGVVIMQALRENLKKAGRPRLKKESPTDVQSPRREMDREDEQEMEQDHDTEPVLVFECGLQTDSMVGFPAYSQ